MAFWVISGGAPPDAPNPFPKQHQHQRHMYHGQVEENETTPYVHRPKRPVDYYHAHHYEGLYADAAYESDGAIKRARVTDWTHQQVLEQDTRQQSRHSYQGHEHDTSRPVRNLAFYVLREGSHSTPPEHVYRPPRPLSPLRKTAPAPMAHFTATTMERTASGLSISSDPSLYTAPENTSEPSLSDVEAANFVLKNITSSHRNSQPSRILHSLIHPPSGPNHPQFQLDHDALTSLFHAANWLFFGGRLSRRVTWDWTSEEDGNPQYDGHIIGTTALRRSATLGSYETLIVLSSPILKDTRYNRRLLIATFLHEMIHSYLFITCGMKAGQEGGHTDGFRRIAEGIDEWVGGREVLGLGEVEADLGRFCEEHSHEDHGYGRLGDWEYQRREGFGGRGDDDRGWDGYTR